MHVFIHDPLTPTRLPAGVHDKDEVATPAQLVQNYIVTPLPEKLDMLWSFIKVRDMRHPRP